MTVNLMVIDAPNIDMVLGSRLGGVPAEDERPQWDILLEWFRSQAPDAHLHLPCIFTNAKKNEESRKAQQRWLQVMVDMGYRVLTKPKIDSTDDIDEDMVDEIWFRAHRNRRAKLKRLVVLSHDVKNFLQPLTDLKHQYPDVDITVVGFSGDAGKLEHSDYFNFVDMMDIQGVLLQDIPRSRVDLEDLPEHGRWFVPVSHKR